MATLCGFFAVLGALPAAIGVYGVNAYAVAQRTNEIGLRVSLGADRRAILAIILREASVLVAAGLFAPAAVAVLAARAARSTLFGLQPDDPGHVSAAVLLLAIAGARRQLRPRPPGRRSRSDGRVESGLTPTPNLNPELFCVARSAGLQACARCQSPDLLIF